MFSVRQKRDLADAIGKLLRATNHPELPPTGPIRFELLVLGAEGWSYARILNNESVEAPSVNPHNERQDQESGHAHS